MVKEEDDQSVHSKNTAHSEDGGLRRNLHSFPYAGNMAQVGGQDGTGGRKENRQKHAVMRPNATDDGSAGGSSDYGISSSNENSPPNSPLMPKGSSASLTSLLNREYRPLIERMRKLIDNNETFFSMEFFPPKTANGVANLLAR